MLYEFFKNHISNINYDNSYEKKQWIIRNNQIVYNHLNEKLILPFEGSWISKLIIDGSGLCIKQQNDCTSFSDQQTNTLI